VQQQHLHVHGFQVFIEEAYQKDTPAHEFSRSGLHVYQQQLESLLIIYKN
jgi:hypothetical protein